ncbi:MAG: 3-hydroxyacyl-ACP dehydratase FabZ [Bdellovibrionales bacterium]|nr:3-hydroxyacyl-ACP dehydratase FabZ [Bdellovibrionales bacterium]
MQEVWDCVKIQKILPHRFPFLLVDRVLEVHPGKVKGDKVGRRVKALKNVTIGEAHFVGHFPKKPVMPGVLILEALAQAGALAFFEEEEEVDVAITAVNKARFRKPVVPGDSLILDVQVTKYRSQMVFLACEAFVDGQKVAEAELTAYVNLPEPK